MPRLTWQALDDRPLVAIDQILAAVSRDNILSGDATDYLTRSLLLALDREELWCGQGNRRSLTTRSPRVTANSSP